jgi:hypothetical protein
MIWSQRFFSLQDSGQLVESSLFQPPVAAVLHRFRKRVARLVSTGDDCLFAMEHCGKGPLTTSPRRGGKSAKSVQSGNFNLGASSCQTWRSRDSAATHCEPPGIGCDASCPQIDDEGHVVRANSECIASSLAIVRAAALFNSGARTRGVPTRTDWTAAGLLSARTVFDKKKHVRHMIYYKSER